MDKAVSMFPPDRLREEFRRKVKAAKGVQVTDVRVKSLSCSPKKGEATVVIDIEYYREPSVTVRTVEDVQNWQYVEEGKDDWIWRLMSLPPDFK
jgi:translation elongation factor P/translation initiation factor 5A